MDSDEPTGSPHDHIEDWSTIVPRKRFSHQTQKKRYSEFQSTNNTIALFDLVKEKLSKPVRMLLVTVRNGKGAEGLTPKSPPSMVEDQLESSYPGCSKPGGTTRSNFPKFRAAHYEILDLVYVNQPVHGGFTTVIDISIDSTAMLIAFKRMRS